jgi:hypothetical protein
MQLRDFDFTICALCQILLNMIKPQEMGSIYLRGQVVYQTVVANRGRKICAKTTWKSGSWRKK